MFCLGVLGMRPVQQVIALAPIVAIEPWVVGAVVTVRCPICGQTHRHSGNGAMQPQV